MRLALRAQWHFSWMGASITPWHGQDDLLVPFQLSGPNDSLGIGREHEKSILE